jgi:hypothetical protein
VSENPGGPMLGPFNGQGSFREVTHGPSCKAFPEYPIHLGHRNRQFASCRYPPNAPRLAIENVLATRKGNNHDDKR